LINKGLFYRCGAEKLLLLESLHAFFKVRSKEWLFLVPFDRLKSHSKWLHSNHEAAEAFGRRYLVA